MKLGRLLVNLPRYLLVALLAFLGIANVYPFVWMLGTSFKATSESNAHRYTALPLLKFHLAEHPPDDRSALAEPERALLKMMFDDRARQAADPDRLTRIPTAITADEFRKKAGLADDTEALGRLRQLESTGYLVADRWQEENYALVWRDMRFAGHFATSLVMTAAVVVLVVLSTSMLGYALARLSFPGKMLIFTMLLIGAVAPREAVIVPIFHMLQSVGLFDGLWGMVLWLSGVGVGNALLMTGFFLSLPREVEEAAAIDGAGPFKTFFHVAFPMARPMVMTVALFAFLGAWNEFQVTLLSTLSRPDMQPLAVAVYRFQRGHPGFWEQINAAAALMIVPVIILFLLLQRHIVKSIAQGAVKG